MVWNKGSDEPISQPRTARGSEASARTASEPARASGRDRVASLGPSISISGNLSGKEDLIIEGTVEGQIHVEGHKVTVSESGRVKADVFGKSICVEGQVNGNLFGDEQVVIRESGRVRGNVTAPRVNLENGSKFKGSIDMQPGTAAEDVEAMAAKADRASKKGEANTASSKSASGNRTAAVARGMGDKAEKGRRASTGAAAG